MGTPGQVPLHPRSGGVGHNQPVPGLKNQTFCTVSGAAGQPRRKQKQTKTKGEAEFPPAETKTDPPETQQNIFETPHIYSTKKRRNTERGIRKEDTIRKRNTRRSLKRHVARRIRRAESSKAHRAQDPVGDFTQTVKPRPFIAYMERLNFATLNAQGINKLEGRLLIEKYMDTHNLDVMFIQDTRVIHNQKERTNTYTWFNSGENPIYKQKPFSSGVAFVVRNTYLNYIKEITPVNDRIIVLTLYATMPITLISAYAPTADKTTEQKEKFYKPLIKEIEKQKEKDQYT